MDNNKTTNTDFQGLFSSKTVDELWYKRGTHLVEGLNQLLEENNVSNRPSDLNQLIQQTFNKPDLFGVYAYASLLHNLQFYMESLKPNTTAEASQNVKQCGPEELLKTPLIADVYNNEPTDPALRDWISNSFGSVAEFRTLLLNSAKGIKGDGTVWLVAQAFYSEKTVKNEKNQYTTLAVMNTYNAGIVNDSIRSGQVTKLQQQKQAKADFLKRKQLERQNAETEGKVEEVIEEEEGVEETKNESKTDDLVLGTVEEAEASALFLDKKLIPLLAIDASPRNYLLDYGVYGKQQYLDNVWDCIDWNVVAERAPVRSKPTIDYI